MQWVWIPSSPWQEQNEADLVMAAQPKRGCVTAFLAMFAITLEEWILRPGVTVHEEICLQCTR